VARVATEPVIVVPDRRSLSYAAAAASLLVPGTGHLMLRRWHRAIPFLAGSLATAILALSLWSRGRFGLLELLVRPDFLRAVLIGNVLVALFRAGAAVDVLLIYRPLAPHYVTAGVATILAFALVVPHVWVADRTSSLLGLLETVFVDDGDVAVAEAQATILRRREAAAARAAGFATEPQPRLTPTTAPQIFYDQPDGIVVPLYGAASDPSLEDIVLDRITVLLAGGDAGPGRDGERTDVMIVATLDRIEGTASLITVSRELVEIPLPPWLENAATNTQEFWWDQAVRAEEGGRSRATEPLPEERDPCCWLDRVNSIYPQMRHLEQIYAGAVDPGMEALADTLSYALGLTIDYYVLVDMAGFVDLVDAIGGITVTSRTGMHVLFSPEREGAEEIVIEIEPGRHHLDGRLALAYVRNRTDSNDYVRTRRQRCMLAEFAAQADLGRIIRNFEGIAGAIERNATTNVPVRLLPHIVSILSDLDREDITTMAVEGGTLAPDVNYRNLHIFDAERTRRAVANLLQGGETGYTSIDSESC
jgi:LCP family protein required for cell wall assembly